MGFRLYCIVDKENSKAINFNKQFKFIERMNFFEMNFMDSHDFSIELNKLSLEIENDHNWKLWALINICSHSNLMGVDWGTFNIYEEQMKKNSLNMVILTRTFLPEILASNGLLF